MPNPTQAEVEEARKRLERFVDGETVRTIYKLPPNGRHDPQRADVAVVLAALHKDAGR